MTVHTVIVILEAKKGMEHPLESALQAVVTPSRAEKTNIEYRLHKSIDNPALFILYENWESKEKHQEQFNKSYIQELGGKLESMLAKPCQIIFANELAF
mgnify:CR=1 FL=1